MDPSPQQGQKTSLDLLSRDELLNKYKSLLGIAKKAKQSKDEILEENHKLKDQLQQYETQKEADKKALSTMREMLEAYTEQKLQLSTELSEVQKQRKLDLETIEKCTIENESLKRQLIRLTDDNDSLLSNIEQMEKLLEKEQQQNQKQQLTVNENEPQNPILETLHDNEKLLRENEELAKSLNELKEKHQFLKEVINEKRQKFNALKDRFIDVHRKLKKLKECKRILLETQHEYADSVSQWQMEIIKASKMLCQELNDLRVKNTALLKKLNQKSISNESSFDAHHINISKLDDILKMSQQAKLDYMKLQQENIELKQKMSLSTTNIISCDEFIPGHKLQELFLLSKTAMTEYNNLQKIYSELKNESVQQQSNNDISLNTIAKLQELKNLAYNVCIEYGRQAEELAALRHTNIEKQPECEQRTDQKEEENSKQFLEELQKLYKEKELEHYELLDEMRELNEALKVRGDCISRLQEDQQLLKKELKNQSENLQNLHREIEEKDSELETNRTKLDDANAAIQNYERKINTLENENLLIEEKVRVLNNELEAMKSAHSNFEYDNQSEIMSTSTISRADEIQRLKDIEDTFEDKYNKLRGLAAKLKKKLQEEISLKQDIEKELDNIRLRETEITTNLQLKCNEMDLLAVQLSEQQKQVDNLKSENHKLKSSRKQANVLNLEIEAAEKSLTEVTHKLAARSSELDNARELLETKESTITQLRKEIVLLESSKSAETKHSEDLKYQINHLQNTLKDAVHSKQLAFEKAEVLEQDVENLKADLESLRLDMATSTGNLEKSLNLIKSEKEKISYELQETQATLTEYEQKLKHAERASEDLKVEYLDYKVKAQSVLRKNQTRESSKERELEEELLSLKNVEVQLKSTIDVLSTKMEQVEKVNETLAVENTSLKIRSKELMQLIDELRLQKDGLNNEIQKNIQQQHETLKQHRQQMDAMDKFHKEQLKAVNTSNLKQMEQLRQELAARLRLPPTIGPSKPLSHTTEPINLADHTKIEFLLMEREDAEGSEEATETLATLAATRKISNASSSNAKRSQHDFMPLDELLNTPMNALSCETLITTPLQMTDEIQNSDKLQLELNSTKECLQKQESRVRHLTALLAENEQDLAKLTQMNDMLKEELRRQERSVEREQHMHNCEYIKNVILKFLTLNNADEKTRLVPVLNTILKLSRSETEILNCVANGQRVSDITQQRGSSWSHFLPWGGSSASSNTERKD